MTNPARSRALDLLKIAMAIAVVGIHANPVAPLGRTAILLTGDGLFRIAVPVFLVINGYFFAQLAEGAPMRAWLKRLGFLYVAWMVLYLPVSWRSFEAQPLTGILRDAVLGYWHLWYLSGTFLAGALVILMRGWGTRALVLVMLTSFGCGLAITWAISWGGIEGKIWYHRNGLFLCLPFFLAGLLIRRHDLAARFSLPALGLMAGLGVVAVLAESLLLSALAPHGVAHDNLLSLALAAPALVMLALRLPLGTAGRELGQYANGIYFTHVAPCALLFRYFREDLSRPVIFALTLGSALVMTWGLIRSGLARRLL